MAEVTVQIDEQGKFGTLPEPLQQFVDRAIRDAYKSGAEKAEQRLADRVVDPAERERLMQTEQDNRLLREEIATRDKNFEEAARLREERFQKTLTDAEARVAAASQEIERRTSRLKDMLGAEIRAAAVAAGAREESLPELSKLLGADVDLDTDLRPFVRASDGSAREQDGKPMSIEGLVREYLASHPHHLKGGRSTSGRAQGGVAVRQAMGQVSDAHDDAFAAVAENPTVRNVGAAIRSMRARATGAKS
jgi:hypothetical protein